MPILNLSDEPLPDIAKLHKLSYGTKYIFRTTVEQIGARAIQVDDPLEYCRLLQTIARPTWYLPYTNCQEYAKFHNGLHKVLRSILAPLYQGPDLVQTVPTALGSNAIAFSWHTSGRKSQLWHYKEAYLPHMLHFDRDGYSGWSEMANMPAGDLNIVSQQIADSYYDKVIAPYILANKSKYKQSSEDTSTGSGYVFIAMQLLEDSTRILSFFKDYLGTVKIIIEKLVDMGFNVVLKRHPLCTDARVDNFITETTSEHVLWISASIHKLIANSAFVITMNSGVGFEALMHLKPVLCIGKADYAIASTEIRDLSKFDVGFVKSAQAKDTNSIKRFLWICLNKYQLDTTSDLAFQYHVLRALCWNFLERGAAP